MLLINANGCIGIICNDEAVPKQGASAARQRLWTPIPQKRQTQGHSVDVDAMYHIALEPIHEHPGARYWPLHVY